MIKNDPTLCLIRTEMERYGVCAELVTDDSLDSFELRIANGKLIIAAPDNIELLYGVYDFAERFGGWDFFEPGRDNFDPARRVSPLPEGVLFPAKKPLLKRRGFIQEFPFDAETPMLFDWMAKNKLNYLLVWMKYYDQLSDELKEAARIRGIVIESGHHNFNYWIPGKVYGVDHPEFFAEIGGKRISPSGNSELLLSEQLCTTNPELRKEIVDRMVQYCAEHPEIKTISLIPNDGFGWCECPECSKFYDRNSRGDFYSVSEHVYKADRIYHDLIRDVAAQLNKVRPDIQLTFCAYVNYCAPSENFTLEPGMAVHMATYWRCINHAIDDPACPINSNYISDIKKWCAVKRGGEVNIYEYFMGVNFYLSLPMLHLDEMFREMQEYHRCQVDGIMTQFHISHWSVYGINYAFMARAARGEAAEAVQKEFFARRFKGDAARGEAFFRRIKAVLAALGSCHIPYPDSFLRRVAKADLCALLEEARRLAEGDTADTFRRELVIWMEYLVRFKEFYDLNASGKATSAHADELLNWIGGFRDTRIFVHQKFVSYFNRVKMVLARGDRWLHFDLDWEDEYIRRHREMLG